MKITGMHILAAMLIAGAPTDAHAARREAEALATLKAVVDVKIDDESSARDIEYLRQNKSFLNKLQRRLAKLNNSRNSDSTNRKVMQILEDAGKQLERALD